MKDLILIRIFSAFCGLLWLGGLSPAALEGQDGAASFEQRVIRPTAPDTAAAPSGESPAPDSPVDATGKNGSMFRMMVGLILVLALIFLCLYLFRRFMPQSKLFCTNRSIQIVARSAINTRQSLCLVRLGKRLLLVGLSPNHMAILDKIDQPEEISLIEGLVSAGQNESISNTFAALFRQESKSYENRSGLESSEDPELLEHRFDQAGQEVHELLDKIKSLKNRSVSPTAASEKLS